MKANIKTLKLNCAVPHCENMAVTIASISINDAPRKRLPVCQCHADAVAEDKPVAYCDTALDRALVPAFALIYGETLEESGPIYDVENAVDKVLHNAGIREEECPTKPEIVSKIGSAIRDLSNIKVEGPKIAKKIDKLLGACSLDERTYWILSHVFHEIVEQTKRNWDEDGYDPE